MSVILILVSIIISLQKEIQSLKSELAAKRKASCKRPGTAAKYLKTDADVLFLPAFPLEIYFMSYTTTQQNLFVAIEKI